MECCLILDPIDGWKLNDTFTIHETALLILGQDPNIFQLYDLMNQPYVETNYHAIKKALERAVSSKLIDADTAWEDRDEIDWDRTLVHASDIKHWLLSKNLKPEFFFSTEVKNTSYLDKDHPRYSAKLAAGVKVWLAMEDDQLLNGKAPIPAMDSFLTSNYKELGLIHNQDSAQHGYKKGDINKGAIREIAKIANWNDKGGAPSTPTIEPTPPSEDIDNIDEIPF
jgi:hypothetical protein